MKGKRWLLSDQHPTAEIPNVTMSGRPEEGGASFTVDGDLWRATRQHMPKLGELHPAVLLLRICPTALPERRGM